MFIDESHLYGFAKGEEKNVVFLLEIGRERERDCFRNKTMMSMWWSPRIVERENGLKNKPDNELSNKWSAHWIRYSLRSMKFLFIGFAFSVMHFSVNKPIIVSKQCFDKYWSIVYLDISITDSRLMHFIINYLSINLRCMELKWFSKHFLLLRAVKQSSPTGRETKQASEILFKLLSGLSQPQIRMTGQQQLFCQQIVDRVRSNVLIDQKKKKSFLSLVFFPFKNNHKQWWIWLLNILMRFSCMSGVFVCLFLSFNNNRSRE